MDNLNQYNENTFKPFFKSHEIYKKLLLKYKEENLYWDKFFLQSPALKTLETNQLADTSREMYEKAFSMSVFYYLLPLLEKEYDNIYDLGCGKNVFKPYIPRLIGVGAEDASLVDWYDSVKDPSWPKISGRDDFKRLPSWIQDECTNVHNILLRNHKFYGDIHGFVNDQYIKEHQDFFQAAFGICSLHYHPLDRFKKVVDGFASMIKPGGRGFIGINLMRMIELTPETTMLSLLETTVRDDKIRLEKYIRSELDKIKDLHWLIVDVDLTLLDEGMDGNVRLVFEK